MALASVRQVSEDFIAHLGAHVTLAGAALVLAVAIGIPAGRVCADRRLLRGLMLALAGGFRVVPSLAVLTLALPLLGLGFRPALLAWWSSRCRRSWFNTDVALRSVPRHDVGGGARTGMTERQIGRRVRWAAGPTRRGGRRADPPPFE